MLATGIALIALTVPADGQTSTVRRPARLTTGTGKKKAAVLIPTLDLAKLQPRKEHTLRGHKKAVNRVAFDSSGSLLASCDEGAQAIVWEVATGNSIKELPRWDFVRDVAFVPMTNTLITAQATYFGAGNSGGLTIYNPETRTELGIPSRAAWSFLALAIHRSGRLLAAGGADRALRVWDLESMMAASGLREKPNPDNFEFAPAALPGEILSIDFYPKPQARPLIAVGCKDGSIKLYQIAGPGVDGIRPSEANIEKQSGAVHRVKFSPDGRLLASAGEEGLIHLRNALTGALVRTIDKVNSPVHGLSFSFDSQLLADARDDKTVRIWKVETGVELASLREHTAPVRDVVFGPDGKRLASCDSDFLVLCWSLFPPDLEPEKAKSRKSVRGRR